MADMKSVIVMFDILVHVAHLLVHYSKFVARGSKLSLIKQG